MSSKNVANAVGGKTARACDSCVRKRARWYCAADDAFLCQSCDASVHSANPLARRHERVRLETASSMKPAVADVPSWHRGFKRKARTPRHVKLAGAFSVPRQTFPLVPEVGADEAAEENDDEQLLYRVPIFDPFAAELCTSSNEGGGADVDGRDVKALLAGYGHVDVDNFDNFLPSDMDLAEFAADVECLLGGGLDGECYGIDGLGLTTESYDKQHDVIIGTDRGKVKVEDDDVMCCHVGDGGDVDLTREAFELNFDYDSPATCGEEEEEKVAVMTSSGHVEGKVEVGRKIMLSLDYESIISSWTGQRSPWTTGHRPDIDVDECWPDCVASGGTEMAMTQSVTVMGDRGREARVSRYREKRRTRLFSKKIRYEVRKLNAEKRPRMKGRFVKKASFGMGTGSVTSAPATVYHSLNK